jgi:hypothetical protein
MISFIGTDSPSFIDIKGTIIKGTGDTIVIPAMALRINRQNLKIETDTTLSVTANDGTFAAFAFGTDYYIYACQPVSGASPIFKLSLNSTYPTGYTATTSRKIGGFHYGKVRNSSTASDVSDNIVANSVWDLLNRPRCSPEGMVKVANFWVDIYLASDDGSSGLKSVYNAAPLTGTEGLHWYNFVERAAKVGKRLLTYAEWCAVAQGSPQGNDGDNINAWSKTTNTGRNPTGTVANATSNYNVRDCVGNVWEWLDELTIRQDSTAWAYQNVLGAGCGQAYLPNSTGLSAFICGGDWSSGVNAGSRTVSLSGYPWHVSTLIGSRAACDSL